MKNLITILAAFAILGINANCFSQNYKTIQPDSERYFRTDSSGYIRAIKIDSVAISGNDTFNFNFNAPVDTSVMHQCIDPYGTSWIGSQTIIQPDGMNIYYTEI